MTMTTTETTAIILRHTEAVTRMLIGERKMKDGVVVTGGGRLDVSGRIALGQMALESDTDVVHCEFDTGQDGTYGLATITLFLPREFICHIRTGCRLYLRQNGARAIILPQDGGRGHFRFSPRELMHIDTRPSDIEAGIALANACLHKVSNICGASQGQFEMTEFPIAA